MKTAIKALILTLALTLLAGGNQWVTAADIGFNYDEQIVAMYLMPTEDPAVMLEALFAAQLPNGVKLCQPEWTYEVYTWVDDGGGSYHSVLADEGACPTHV